MKKSYNYKNNKNKDIDIYTLYYNEIRNIPVLSQEEIVELIKKAQAGDIEARNSVIEHNLKLILQVASRCKQSDMPLLDAIQIGNEEAFLCVKRYDVNSSVKFSSYLAKCVYYAVKNGQFDLLNVVNIPRSVYNIITSIGTFVNKFYSEYQMEPTSYDIMYALNVKKMYVDLYKLLNSGLYVNIDEIKDADSTDLENNYRFNLNDILGQEDENIERFLTDETNKELRDDILISNLTKKQKYALLYKYGFVDGKPHTLTEIGQRYNFTRERARQLHNRALVRVRNSSIASKYM